MREKAEQDRDVFWYRCDRCQTYCTWKFADGQSEAECVWKACEAGWTQPREGVHWCPACSKRDAKPALQPEPNFVSAAREFLSRANAAVGESLCILVRAHDVSVRFDVGNGELGRAVASAEGPAAYNVMEALSARVADLASVRAAKQRGELAATEAALAALKGGAR